MANITANFRADFSSFLAAVDKAELKLADFGKGASQVEDKLNKMIDNFSGRKLIQEASLMTIALEKSGGMSTLTANELAAVGAKANEAAEKMKKLGYEVPPGLQKIADATRTTSGHFDTMKSVVTSLATSFGVVFSVAAVVNFGKALLADADALVKLHDKTGLSMQALQKFQIAGDDAGNSLDEITSAIVKMEDKLVGGDASAEGALRKLGLSFEDLQGLSPENQFIKISDAIRTIDDPAKQVNIAIDLFGKTGANVLPTLKRGFDDLKHAAVGMSDETILAMEEASDTMERWWRITKGATAEATVGFVRIVQAGLNPTVKAAHDLGREAEALTRQLKDMTAQAAAAAPKLAMMVTPNVQQIFRDLEKDIDADAASLKKVGTEAHTAADKFKTEFAASTQKVHELESALFLVPDALRTIGRSFDESKLAAMVEALERVENKTHIAVFGFRGMADALQNVGTKVDLVAPKMWEFVGPELPDSLIRANTALHDMASAFAQLAQISGGTFGGIVKALAEVTAAMELGTKAGAQLADGLAGNKGSLVTGVIGSVAAMDAATKSTSRWTATMGGAATGAAIGSKVFPIVGAWIGAAAGALVGWIRSAGAAERAINPLREQFVQLAGGLEALNVQAHAAGVTLDAMLNAKNPEQYKKAIDELSAALDLQGNAMQVLEETVDRYGFSIEQLGPAFASQKLHEQAGQLLMDYQVLSAGGVQHNAIIEKMAPNLQKYVNASIAAGIAIPESMRPVLQGMVDLGLLTDTSGEKLTDLEGLTFAETLDKKFSTLIDTINKLADAISRGVGGAIAAIPTEKVIHIGYQYDPYDPPTRNVEGASRGGLVTPGGIVPQYLAGGGHVLRFMPRGTDTVPAMLTPGERVLSVKETKAYNAGAARGGGGRWAAPDFAPVVAAVGALRAELARRDREFPTRLRDAVMIATGRAA